MKIEENKGNGWETKERWQPRNVCQKTLYRIFCDVHNRNAKKRDQLKTQTMQVMQKKNICIKLLVLYTSSFVIITIAKNNKYKSD